MVSTTKNSLSLLTNVPNLKLCSLKFLATENPSALINCILNQKMVPFYKSCLNELQRIKIDSNTIAEIESENEIKLIKLEAAIQDSMENMGDSDIIDAIASKCEFLLQIGDKANALSLLRVLSEKAISIAMRLDIVFAQLRLGILYNDEALIKHNIEKAKELLVAGGDWERRNKLKVYEAVYLIWSCRDFKTASNLLVESLATFSCTEFVSFPEFIKYTVISAALSLDRVDLKKKVIESPEVNEVIFETPYLKDFLDSIFSCNYSKFFFSLVDLERDVLKNDWILGKHSAFIVKEMRLLAYNQFLESYKSVTLQNMSDSFGISLELLDFELYRFITSGKIKAVIDKIAGVVITNRPDTKNSNYQQLIHSGDILLNRIQNLSKVISA